jgi:DNA-binding GntR family transcriptional regulator
MRGVKQGTKTKESGFRLAGSMPERKSLGQFVYENLKKAIVSGDFAPSSRVIESRLAEDLGISRTPVREAIHKLEREGLLRHSPSAGFFVAGLSRSDIEETFGIRSVLESYAARLATIKHRVEELAPLDEKVKKYQRCLDKGQMSELPKINTEFHDLLYGLSHSPRLIKMINDLRDQMYRFRQVLLQSETMARMSNDDHRKMLESMRMRDEEGVERLVREHILRGQEAVLREFDIGSLR